MKVNNTPAKEDFCPVCEVCEQSIHENPVYYVELEGSTCIKTVWENSRL